MYDSFVQETQGERKELLRCFDFRKSLEKSERKEWGNRAWRGRKVEGIIAGELKEKKNREKREKKNERALRPKGAISSTGCASHSIINFVELLFRT